MKIMFVCHGNICRSSMAFRYAFEWIFEALDRSLRAVSRDHLVLEFGDLDEYASLL